MPFCVVCGILVKNKSWVGHLRSNLHKQNNCSGTINIDGVRVLESAFRNRIVAYRIDAATEPARACLNSFLQSIRNNILKLINESLQKHTTIKVNFELFSKFLMIADNREVTKSFGTKNIILYRNYDFENLFEVVQNTLKNKMEEYETQDSGWSFLCNLCLEININKYQPLGGSSYIDLPKHIKNKKACLNIKNRDQCCFLWAVTAALYPASRHPERVSSYPNFSTVLNTSNLTYPITFSDIKIFEENNPRLKFIIFGLNNKNVVGPLYKSQASSKDNKITIHILMIERGRKTHYCLIKELSRLVRSQITSHHSKLYFCDTCLIFFTTSEQLDRHICEGIVTVLPNRGSVIKFKNFERKQSVPFVIYADFETLLQPTDDQPDTSCTSTSHRHIPAAFAYHVVCTEDSSYNRFVSYRGSDCVDMFIESIYNDVNKINKIMHKNRTMIFDEHDAKQFSSATRCHICSNLLFSDRVRDHNHLTGRYRGAAHSICNLQYKQPSFIPIFFHNLAGYDCHLFIMKLGEAPGAIKIIPKTKENYISFTKFVPVSNSEFVQLRFVDSLKFLGTSLDKLTKTMQISDFRYLHDFFQNEHQFCLLTRKGVYPYEYMDSFERYKERSLPSKENFYSALNKEIISNEDYVYAQSIWSEFNIKNLGQYTDLYLKTDVILLTDIFEKFRKTCKCHYQLDPAFYVSAPSLSFDAMLLKTGVELELIDDLPILKMIQDGIRGGVCMCSQRHSQANNKYLSDYDLSKPDKFIAYFDCNNLYGYAMSLSLPLSCFSFLTRCEIDKLNVSKISDDAEYGYILEVDLIYPKELHDFHNDFPFCPEKCIPPGGKNEKLVPNLYDKYLYVIHYVHLKTCLKHGLKLRNIHRVIKFKQSPFLKQYIDLNTKLRQEAKSTFEQDFFKLLNNSIFGKTLENSEKRVNVHLVNQWSDSNNITKKRNSAGKLIAKPNFHSATVFSENLVAIQLKPDRLVLDKPIYIGFAVLELSKSHMYDFHYSVFKPFYNSRLTMCYTDTDSFIYDIRTEDLYKDLKNIFLRYFDTSNYPLENDFDLPLLNKKVPGLFKDEMGGRLIKEFVGLRSKLYCIKTADNIIVKKAKGVKSCVVRDFTISDYEKTLFQGDVVRKVNVLFKTIKHTIFTQSINKIALSNDDDKRLISQDKISTRAWGHKSLLKY